MIGIQGSGSRIQGGGDVRQMAGLADSCIRNPASSRGFTLVEMIIVIVITGIIGGIVAVFLRAPIQQYTDIARRAEMTDIADTALRRITRDLRLALPNSVRVTGACDGAAACFIEFLPTKGGGRYRAGPGGDELDFTSSTDSSFEVLGPMPTGIAAGTDQIVVYNLGIPGADAYAGNAAATHNRRLVSGAGANSVNITSANALPFDSPGHRFHVISTPVTYVCSPVAGGTGGTLRRYHGYAIQAAQPADIAAAPLSTASSALLASNVSSCRFAYDAFVVAQRHGLVTMNLGISEQGETVTLYSAAHVSNQP